MTAFLLGVAVVAGIAFLLSLAVLLAVKAKKSRGTYLTYRTVSLSLLLHCTVYCNVDIVSINHPLDRSTVKMHAYMFSQPVSVAISNIYT